MFNGKRIEELEEKVKRLEKQLAYSFRPGYLFGIPCRGEPDILLKDAVYALVDHLGLVIERKEEVVCVPVKKSKK